MDPLEEARQYLATADAIRRMPFAQYGSLGGPGIEEFERRDRQVLQLHIRAMVAAVGVIAQAIERLDQGEQ